jgi:hypothetical protein
LFTEIKSLENMTSQSAESPAEYWGTFLNGSQPSPMFLRLNLALIEFARATTCHDTLALPPDQAYPLLNYHHFFALAPLFVDKNMAAELLDQLPKIPVRFHEPLALILMEGLDIPLFKGMFSRKSCHSWITGVTLAYPDEIHATLNEFLQAKNYLLDPLTDQSFVFNEIPRSCFPAAADSERVKRYEQLSNEIEPKFAKLGVEIREALQTEATSQSSAFQPRQTQAQALALAQADFEAQRMRSVALHGEIHYDEQGRKRYRGGAFDSLKDANF